MSATVLKNFDIKITIYAALANEASFPLVHSYTSKHGGDVQ